MKCQFLFSGENVFIRKISVLLFAESAQRMFFIAGPSIEEVIKP